MSLDKPPPSRYRIEEKNGQLIVHDSQTGTYNAPAAAEPSLRSALDGAVLAQPVSPSQPSRSAGASGADAGKAKRAATVAALALGLALFLFITKLWPILVVAMLIGPIRKQVLGNALPAVKRYIEEGR